MVVLITIELNDIIIESIWKHRNDVSGFTVKDLIEDTSLPYTTIVHRVLRYESQGVLASVGKREEAVGRPLNLWSVVPAKFEEIIGKVIE